jgi:23S rRNA (uracil1939-C5)-methyltransferase
LPYTVWKGPAYLTEQLGDFRFRISPTSFFQTNPSQAARLYEVVREFLAASLPKGQTQHGVVYDLYSGTGSIGIFVSKLARHIVGIEYVDSAVADAWENVRLNGLEDQFSFYAGDLQALLTEELTEKEGAPDVIIVDPPRAGMAPKVVDRLLELAPSHIIYVSCKPATQARDVEVLKSAYEVKCIQPVDMFPHTAHVENVAWLVRR